MVRVIKEQASFHRQRAERAAASRQPQEAQEGSAAECLGPLINHHKYLCAALEQAAELLGRQAPAGTEGCLQTKPIEIGEDEELSAAERSESRIVGIFQDGKARNAARVQRAYAHRYGEEPPLGRVSRKLYQLAANKRILVPAPERGRGFYRLNREISTPV